MMGNSGQAMTSDRIAHCVFISRFIHVLLRVVNQQSLNQIRIFMNVNTKVLSAAVLLGTALFASSSVSAKDEINSSTNLLCAAFDVMACTDGGHCTRGEAKSFDLPEFMKVDFKKKAVIATYDDGTKTATSPIKNSEVSGNQLILQGVENNHGWSMAIHRESGRMNLASVGYEVSFTIFGACQAL
jgi:hypothetical protein